MAKPKVEIQKSASKFVDRNAVKRLSKKRAELGYLVKESDLPPWKRSSPSSKEPTSKSDSRLDDQNRDPNLTELFNTVFSKDYASILLTMGAVGGFGFGVCVVIFFNHLKWMDLDSNMTGSRGWGIAVALSILTVWSVLLITLCRMNYGRKLRTVASAMSSEMLRAKSESESHASDPDSDWH